MKGDNAAKRGSTADIRGANQQYDRVQQENLQWNNLINKYFFDKEQSKQTVVKKNDIEQYLLSHQQQLITEK